MFFITAQISRTARHQHPQEERLGRTIADRRVDLDHGDVIARGFHGRQVMKGIPVQATRLAGADTPPSKKQRVCPKLR